MAALSVPIVDLTSFNSAVLAYGAGLVAGTIHSTDGALLTPTKQDEKLLLQINVVTGANVTVKAGDSHQATVDYVFAGTGSRTYYLALETGKYKNITGTNKGKIVITSSQSDTTILAIQLP